MAIPFNLPTDEETEENYRRLDQLLLDLYDVLRQILLRRTIQRAHRPETDQTSQSFHNHHHNNHGNNPDSSSPQQPQQPEDPAPRSDLPDLLQSAGAAAPMSRKPPVPPPRRRRRRGDWKQQSGQQQQRRAVSGSARSSSRQERSAEDGSPSWLNVGIELRQIAEEFRSSQIYGDEEKTRKEIKASSLFSLLVPAPITGSIWTTVIILVGWRILARHR